jgi:hypothetical protein
VLIMKNREIKFRYWDVKSSSMYYFDSDSYCYFQEMLEDSESYKIMQFTGLLDKNGKEIYEGDIVEFGIIGVVEYYLTEFIVNCENISTRVSILHEVVGNIYENKELIK